MSLVRDVDEQSAQLLPLPEQDLEPVEIGALVIQL
jgi:hypothetical protein